MQDDVLSANEIKQLTETDWQSRLDPEAYYVLRQKGTERAFTGIYTDTTDKGVYRCKGCNSKLFDSEHKFHSGCGWPSFDRAINDNALTKTLDLSHGMQRIEVTCSHCGGHLGHVFSDEPRQTTGLRYCINSVAIELDKE